MGTYISATTGPRKNDSPIKICRILPQNQPEYFCKAGQKILSFPVTRPTNSQNPDPKNFLRLSGYNICLFICSVFLSDKIFVRSPVLSYHQFKMTFYVIPCKQGYTGNTYYRTKIGKSVKFYSGKIYLIYSTQI